MESVNNSLEHAANEMAVIMEMLWQLRKTELDDEQLYIVNGMEDRTHDAINIMYGLYGYVNSST